MEESEPEAGRQLCTMLKVAHVLPPFSSPFPGMGCAQTFYVAVTGESLAFWKQIVGFCGMPQFIGAGIEVQ